MLFDHKQWLKTSRCVQLSSVFFWPYCRRRCTLLVDFPPLVSTNHNTRQSSPLAQADASSPAPTPAPTCTHTILKQPSFARICTNYGKTLTYTSYTDCGVGCTLVTKRLGLGLVRDDSLSMVEKTLMLCSHARLSDTTRVILGLP